MGGTSASRMLGGRAVLASVRSSGWDGASADGMLRTALVLVGKLSVGWR